MKNISNANLTLTMIPGPDAGWYDISAFALQFDGYQVCGSFEECAKIANSAGEKTLTELRTCLFFEQRRWRHFGEDPDEKAMVYIRGIIEKIRAKIAAQEYE